MCEALDSRLATEDEVKEAYQNGADWCNYGWSQGQKALYPTQQTTHDSLDGYENDIQCGDVGVNGGYFDSNLEFGVNCYGYKPVTSKTYTSSSKYNYYNELDLTQTNQNSEVENVNSTTQLVANNSTTQSVANNSTTQPASNNSTTQSVANNSTTQPEGNNSTTQPTSNNSTTQPAANSNSNFLATFTSFLTVLDQLEGFSSEEYKNKIVSGEINILPFRARQWSINDDVHTIYSGYTNQDLIKNNYNSSISYSNNENNSNSVTTTDTINEILNNSTSPPENNSTTSPPENNSTTSPPENNSTTSPETIYNSRYFKNV